MPRRSRARAASASSDVFMLAVAMRVCAVLLALVTAMVLARVESDVVELTIHNFESVLKKTPIALVQFYVRAFVQFNSFLIHSFVIVVLWDSIIGSRLRGAVWAVCNVVLRLL